LLISAYVADELVLKGIHCKGLHFLSKPFSREQLHRKISDVMTDSHGSSSSIHASI
jgi:YesN/AraC family two-component response regulator